MLPKKLQDRLRRKMRIRSRMTGTAARPRLTVYRSLTSLSVQIVDDEQGKTLCSASSKEAKAKMNIEGAKKVGELIAKKAKDAGVSAVVFDRNAYRYHGRVKAVADAAREGGLKF
jgi:large subunit ribosomal protein L18